MILKTCCITDHYTAKEGEKLSRLSQFFAQLQEIVNILKKLLLCPVNVQFPFQLQKFSPSNILSNTIAIFMMLNNHTCIDCD